MLFATHLGAVPLGDGAHCLPTHTYATTDGMCHAPEDYPGKSPRVMAPSCDNGGVWMADEGVCEYTGPSGYEGSQTGQGVEPHPENAAKALSCIEAGGWWSDTPPACHDLPGPSTPAESGGSSKYMYIALALGVLGGAGYLLYRSYK